MFHKKNFILQTQVFLLQDRDVMRCLSFRCCAQLVGSKHVLPFMFEDLSGGEAQVFITDITVINSGETRHRGGTRFSTFWLWKPQHILTIRLKIIHLFQIYRHQVSSLRLRLIERDLKINIKVDVSWPSSVCCCSPAGLQEASCCMRSRGVRGM